MNIIYISILLLVIYKLYYYYIYYILKNSNDDVKFNYYINTTKGYNLIYFLYKIYLLVIYYGTKNEYNRLKNDINIWNIKIFYNTEFIDLLGYNDDIKIKKLSKFIKFNIDDNFYKDTKNGCLYISCHTGLIHHMPFVIQQLHQNKPLGNVVYDLGYFNFLYTHNKMLKKIRRVNNNKNILIIKDKNIFENIYNSDIRYILALTDNTKNGKIKCGIIKVSKKFNIPIYYTVYYFNKDNQLQFDCFKLSEPSDNFQILEKKMIKYHNYYRNNYSDQILNYTSFKIKDKK